MTTDSKTVISEILDNDPNELKRLPRLVRAAVWRLPLEFWQLVAKLSYKPLHRCIRVEELSEYVSDRGETYADTSVTGGQRELLIRALRVSEAISFPVVEVGSWRGATTEALAKNTARKIFAVDPYHDTFGSPEIYAKAKERLERFQNVQMVRMTSGKAARELCEYSFSFVFIDAIHDYLNTWFDYKVWGRLIARGGILAFHDVDDHVGTNLACRRVLARKEFIPWGYCPNLMILRRCLE